MVLTGADAAEAASRSPAAKLVHGALTEIAAAEWPGVRGREQTRLRNDRTRLRLINSFLLEKIGLQHLVVNVIPQTDLVVIPIYHYQIEAPNRAPLRLSAEKLYQHK